METVMIYIVIVLFMLLIGIAMVKAIIDAIKSNKYVLVDATIIDKVEEYTKEWGKYFPEQYEKANKAQEVCEKIDEISNRITELRESIPIKINKKGLSINIKGKKHNLTSNLDDTKTEPSYVFVCEYEVNGKKYYYGSPCKDNASLKQHLNKKIAIKYNPNNPELVVVPKSWIKTTLICFAMEIVLIIFLYMFEIN